MNRAWANSLSDFWHSANLPMWLAIVAAGIFVVALVVMVFRAERSFAKGGLIVIVLLALGIAVIVMMTRGPSSTSQSSASVASATAPDRRPAVQTISPQAPIMASLPALSCLDGIAGESVENACEKAVFASAESTAAAVSYAAVQITRLASFGAVVNADKMKTPELTALRRTIERDRYGLIAQVLLMREGCTSTACPFFQSLTSAERVTSNMNERLYDGFVGNYAQLWNTSVAGPQTGAPPMAALAPGALQGKPLSGDFPNASSIPPVNIMTPEPSAQGAQSAPRAPDGDASSARAPSEPASAKKKNAQKSRAQAPVSLAPAQAGDNN